jgi:toluene monooxygenase system protein B
MSQTESVELGPEDRAPELVPLNAIFATDFVEILIPRRLSRTRRRRRTCGS